MSKVTTAISFSLLGQIISHRMKETQGPLTLPLVATVKVERKQMIHGSGFVRAVTCTFSGSNLQVPVILVKGQVEWQCSPQP